MEQTSNVSNLKKRLQQKTEQDQRVTRDLILVEQEKLLNDLQSTYSAALNTTLNDIRESLRSRLGDMALLTAQEAQAVEKMIEQHKVKLNEIINSQYEKAAQQAKKKADPAVESLNRLTRSLKKAEEAAEKVAKANRKRWIIGSAAGLSVFLIICVGSWGLIQYLSSQIQQKLVMINQQEATIQHLVNQTQGIRIIQTAKGMFVLLPKGAQTGFVLGEQSAVKLPTN